MSSTTSDHARPRTTAATRWRLVDALRGFALFGILLVNVPDITRLGWDLPPGEASASVMQTVLDVAVQTRFVPVFAFLFGMSMTFVVEGARRRGSRPAWPLLLRLGTLLVIGIVHGLLYPGEILREYAIGGLLVLPAVLLLPRWVTLAAGITLTVAAYAVTGGGVATLPGLLLAGAGAAAYGLPRILDEGRRPVWIVFAVAAATAIPALWWQSTEPGDPRFTTAGGVAGLVVAIVYVTGFALLWQTPLRRALAGAFEPLGRMALSNYVGATVVLAVVALVVDFRTVDDLAAVCAGAVGLIAVQSLLSRLWLARFRYGPIEWVWRMATWRSRVALLRPVASSVPFDGTGAQAHERPAQ